jgi:hypothetical protein
MIRLKGLIRVVIEISKNRERNIAYSAHAVARTATGEVFSDENGNLAFINEEHPNPLTSQWIAWKLPTDPSQVNTKEIFEINLDEIPEPVRSLFFAKSVYYPNRSPSLRAIEKAVCQITGEEPEARIRVDSFALLSIKRDGFGWGISTYNETSTRTLSDFAKQAEKV